MRCDYDGREIEGKPFVVRMHKQSPLVSSVAPATADGGPQMGYRYFHDETCYNLFVQDEDEYDAVDLPGQEIG